MCRSGSGHKQQTADHNQQRPPKNTSLHDLPPLFCWCGPPPEKDAPSSNPSEPQEGISTAGFRQIYHSLGSCVTSIWARKYANSGLKTRISYVCIVKFPPAEVDKLDPGRTKKTNRRKERTCDRRKERSCDRRKERTCDERKKRSWVGPRRLRAASYRDLSGERPGRHARDDAARRTRRSSARRSALEQERR